MIKQDGLFYFVGPTNPVTEKFRDFLLENSKKAYRTESKDEINQGALQSGRTVIIFSDAKFALEFLTNNSFADASIRKTLLIEKDGSYPSQTMEKFRLMGLKFYSPKTVPVLVQDIKNYLAGKEDVVLDDIEFAVNEKIKKGY